MLIYGSFNMEARQKQHWILYQAVVVTVKQNIKKSSFPANWIAVCCYLWLVNGRFLESTVLLRCYYLKEESQSNAHFFNSFGGKVFLRV